MMKLEFFFLSMNLRKMLQHLDEIDGIVLACREKMMEKAGNDSLQL